MNLSQRKSSTSSRIEEINNYSVSTQTNDGIVHEVSNSSEFFDINILSHRPTESIEYENNITLESSANMFCDEQGCKCLDKTDFILPPKVN